MVNYDFTLTSDSVAEAIAHKVLEQEVQAAEIARKEFNDMRTRLYPKVKKAFDEASYTATTQHDDIIEATIKVLEFYHKEEVPKWKTKVTFTEFLYNEEDEIYQYNPRLFWGVYGKLNYTDKQLFKQTSKLASTIEFVPEDEDNCDYCWDAFPDYSIDFEFDNPVTLEEHKALVALHGASRHINTKERLAELIAEYNTAVVAELVGSDEKTSDLINRVVTKHTQKQLNA